MENKKRIGVIGAGVMGSGVAQTLAQYDYHVTLIDIKKSQLDAAQEKITKQLRYHSFMQPKQKPYDINKVMANITFSQEYAELPQQDIIIENITENWTLKKSLYQILKQHCRADSIVCVNTSAIPITKVASLLDYPERVVGVHFMNPVPMMPMVELIKGYHTSAHAISVIQHLLTTIEKKYVVVNDSPGFVTNRAMMIFVNEAIYMVQENVAQAEEIDTLFKQCFGHKMGPLQTADLIGLDTILYSLNVLYEEFNDPKYRPCWLLKNMVDAGLHGEKSKQGFYHYE